MSGETTLLILDEWCVALWGTGVGYSYPDTRNALRGIAADETLLVADWWASRDDIRRILRLRADRLDLVPPRAWSAALEPHQWREHRPERRKREHAIVCLRIARDGEGTRVLWLAPRAESSDEIRALESSLVQRRRCVPSTLPGFMASSDSLVVECEEIAVRDVRHGRLLGAYVEACCAAALSAPIDGLLSEACIGEESQLRLGDASFRMEARFRPSPGVSARDIQAALGSVVAAVPVPDALVRIESERPRRPEPVQRDLDHLRVVVDTSYWMSLDDGAAWRADAERSLAKAVPRLVGLLETAAVQAEVPLTTFAPDAPGTDGFQLPYRGEGLRATIYFTTRDLDLDGASRHRLWQALSDRAQPLRV